MSTVSANTSASMVRTMDYVIVLDMSPRVSGFVRDSITVGTVTTMTIKSATGDVHSIMVPSTAPIYVAGND